MGIVPKSTTKVTNFSKIQRASSLDSEIKFFWPFNLWHHYSLLVNLIRETSFLYPWSFRWTIIYLKFLFTGLFCSLYFKKFFDPLLIPNGIWSYNGYSSKDGWTVIAIPLSVNLVLYLYSALFWISHDRVKLI